MSAKGVDDTAADRVVADDREGPERDGAAELVGHRRQKTGDFAAYGGERGRVAAVGVDDPADIGHVPVDVGVRGGVRRGLEAAPQGVRVHIGLHHALGGEFVEAQAARLDE